MASIETDMSKKDATVDWDKVDEMALALMHLTTFEERGGARFQELFVKHFVKAV
jgi:hypothetical protein